MEDFTKSLKAIEKSIDCISSGLPETAHLYTDGIEAAICDGFAKLGPGIGGQWFDKSLENIDTSVEGVEDRLTQLNHQIDHATKWLHDINISLRLLAQMKAYELSRSGVPMPDAIGTTITQPLDQDGNSPYWCDEP
mgnify:FL=1|jgi:hypothetical protein|tara:strand:+ start:57 stop:464 length:408 start_codon:yes stop_codon:yes gene_type:complete